MINKIKLHEEIILELHDTYIAKNSDYGDSFSTVRKEFPNAILIRLGDKMSRLKTLMSGTEAKVNNESIDDTLLDTANYCIMEIIERKIDSEYLKMYQNRKSKEEDLDFKKLTEEVNNEDNEFNKNDE